MAFVLVTCLICLMLLFNIYYFPVHPSYPRIFYFDEHAVVKKSTSFI